MRKYGLWIIRWMLRILSVLVLLIVLLAATIQLPYIQTRLISKITDGFSDRTGTEISIARVALRITGSVTLKGVYLEDLTGDTLLFADHIGVSLRMRPLMRNHIHVRQLTLGNITANITRAKPDTVFNYDVLFQSLMSDNELENNTIISETDTMMTEDSMSDSEDQTPAWSFSLDAFRLKDARVHFFDYMDGMDVYLSLGQFSTGMDNIDPSQSIYHVGKTKIEDLFVTLTTSEPAVQRPEKEPGPYLFPDIDLALQRLDARGVKLVMASHDGEPDVFDLDILAENLILRKDTAGLDLVSLTGNMMDQIQIGKLSAGLAIGDGISIQDMALETTDSYLYANLFLDTSLEEAFDLLNSADTQFDSPNLMLGINRFRLGQDITKLVPDNPTLKELLAHHGAIHLTGSIQGQLDRLSLEAMELEVPGLLELKLRGDISGLPDIDHAGFLFPEIRLTTKTEGWNNISMLANLSNQYQLPPTIESLIYFDGTYRDFMTRVAINTDFGAIRIKAAFTDLPGKIASYDSQITMDRLMLGEILGLEMLQGDVSGAFDIVGSGLTVETMDVDVGINLNNATINNYDYKDLALHGKVYYELSTLEASYHDENLSFSLTGEVSLNDDYPTIRAVVDLFYLDGRALNLTEDTLLLKTSLLADLTLTPDNFFDGMVHLTHTDLLFGDQTYRLDSLIVLASSPLEPATNFADQTAPDRSFMLEVHSEILTADYRGNISPLNIQPVMANHLNSYFGIDDEAVVDSLSHEKFSDSLSHEKFSFSFTINPSGWYTEVLLPELESFEKFSFDGGFDGTTGALYFNGLIPDIVYSGIGLKGIDIHSITDPEKATFEVGFENIRVAGIELHAISTAAVIEDQRLQLSLWAGEKTGEPWVAASGDLSDMKVIFKDSDLEQVFSRDALYPLSGIIDGTLQVHDVTEDLSFLADLTISTFGYSDDTFGDITLRLHSGDLSSYFFDASIRNFGNQLEASGRYSLQDDPDMEVSLVIRRLELSALEVFTSGAIEELEGIVVGDVRVWGPPANLNYSGSIAFKDARFLASFVNVYYSMPDETILFERDRVNFSNFSLLDPQGRRASLSGTINTADFFNPVFDLNLTSENFLALRLEPGQNELLSGRVMINSNLRLRGNLSSPVIDGSLKLNEGSSFIMNLPQSAPEAIGDEGIVLFISPDADGFDTPASTSTDALASSFSNLDVSINVEVDPMTSVRINIDEYAGDFLSIKGGGMISYGTDPGGRISLSGRYELAEGTYLLTFYDVLSRQFGIVRGSTIMWTGDPMNPNVDIRAVYNIRTSARELFGASPGSGDLSEMALRQTFPFQVFLEMKGPLNTPHISFDISLPPDQQNALGGRLQSRLNQLSQNESELNKQVFALLTIGSFIPENPFDAGMEGPGVSAAARSSASRLLTQQLNRLSDQYVRGIDIHFDIESFEGATEAGFRGSTQLNLEVSKNFFDERLRVTVGGNIELEDESRRNTSAGDIAGDFSIEYVLTPSGNLVLKGFRKKEFDDLFEGQVIETGVALLYNRTYNRLKELFGRKDGG